MNDIVVTSGKGSAQTDLASFDSALVDCGIGDYNLIRLSSVLPPHAKVVQHDSWVGSVDDWGLRMYLVYAHAHTSIPGDYAWAGIGWAALRDDGAGLFVEHVATSEEECRVLLRQSLEELCRSRGLNPVDYRFSFCVEGIKCESESVSAIVVAIYKVSKWGIPGSE